MHDFENIERHLAAEHGEIDFDPEIEVLETDGGVVAEETSLIETAEENWKEYDKYRILLAGAGAGTALYAAADPSAAGNAQMVDVLGHYGLGLAGSLTSEIGYRLTGQEEERGYLPKYMLMVGSGTLAGGMGQAAQTVLSGTPELKSVAQGSYAALMNMAGQYGADSTKEDFEPLK